MSQNVQYAFFRVATSASSSTTVDDLNQFINSHRVTHVEKHFHSEGSEGYWSFCLQWQSRNAESITAKDTVKIDYKAILTADQFPLFSKLRERRKQLAEQEGVPVYAVATNEQLASMVRDNVSSKAQLLRIAGFGSSKADRFGEAFLELIRSSDENSRNQSVAAPPTHPAD